MHWDPDRIIFVLPIVNHPLTWYGVFFAFGFFVGYFLIRKIFEAHLLEPGVDKKSIQEKAVALSDRLAVLVILGTVVGARLGHVFFYGWPYYKHHLWEIPKVWEGGLASHGGAIGVLVGLIIFSLWVRKKTPKMTVVATLDALVIPAAFAGGCIRVGNFINQEILGTRTTLPWGVRFGHPIDGPIGTPLHPVQLYEAFFYFATFFFLYTLWRWRGRAIGTGVVAGWFFVLVFLFRFFIEFIKLPQSQWVEATGGWRMGQLLSLPFVFLGLGLLIYARWKRRHAS